MTHIESILKQLQQIIIVERNNQEERWKRGECFNIFQILSVSTSEVRLLPTKQVYQYNEGVCAESGYGKNITQVVIATKLNMIR